MGALRGETIAAVSTPWGEGGIGVIRISGPEALSVADSVIRLPGDERVSSLPPRTVRLGRAVAPGGVEIDEAVVFTFHAPRSYTREDLVEIQAHGGRVVLSRLLQAVLDAGAVLAEPGEFTERAVRNGRLNLVQAEAVLDLIRAKTDGAARAALRRLGEEGGKRLAAMDAEVLSLLAEIEACLDFPEEIETPAAAGLAARARGIIAELDVALAQADRGRLLNEGATVAIAGRPNAGKSSLLNALLGEDRAIVSPLPGTTRDAVAEEANLGGIPVRLVDTAGLGRAGGELEAMGMARSLKEIGAADLTLLVLDGGAALTPEDHEAAKAVADRAGIAVVNKADLPRRLRKVPEPVRGWPRVTVSALTGEGLEGLIEAVVEALGGRPGEEAPLLSRARQIEAAQEARSAMGDFAAGLARGMTLDVLAEDLRAAAGALGRLTGRALQPELLREIFARFCVGK
ncbi:MAG: tRNA uridine-5-carboxymethylaminomethyl(34) synthesis GTPase MnmE [Patescibacteria group bacterium]